MENDAQSESAGLQPAFYELNETFDLDSNQLILLEGYKECGHPAVPAVQPYVFDRDRLRKLLAFLDNPEGDGLYLCGPTGCGKTSLVSQAAARLHWPVQMVPVHGRLELDDLLGQKVLDKGSTPFQYGALSIAVKEGHILILDEMDVADPAELAGLYDLLDGAPLVFAQNGGEIIPVHPRFRFVATGNSAGAGDGSGLYQGVLRQSLAWLDRFRVISVDYPDEFTELMILNQVVPGLPVVVREKMVKLANEVRRLFTGDSDGRAGEGESQLSVTLSTRGLVRWARLSLRFQGAPRVFEYALEQALTARVEPAERQAIHRIGHDVFGDLWSSGVDS
ncbi:CbbQ/NirQ/NorQ/GpvN family protein [Endozoicomonas sp. SESOKO3]|uniref:CbbQ/NirQ/NorQ/GpvN family protein n=1 Tax=Endozoicomonas sp. SESOKO3 TaxID=2828744 RepID=UPI0021480303|nr:CbbQ/NirQ/NorQ/GpvN family protein [Endozoicomonas sp. SESOKO3]